MLCPGTPRLLVERGGNMICGTSNLRPAGIVSFVRQKTRDRFLRYSLHPIYADETARVLNAKAPMAPRKSGKVRQVVRNRIRLQTEAVGMKMMKMQDSVITIFK